MLQVVHGEPHLLIHRDVRPSNFFYLGFDTVLLNDWADSVQVGFKGPHRGAPGGFRAPWIIKPEQYEPHARDDLYSFLVSCFTLTHGQSTTTAAPGVLPEKWSQLIPLARECAYDQLLAGVIALIEVES
jgi:hypothetical protein